jgi:oxygen-independent coproporphyrinogen-3 oxidase
MELDAETAVREAVVVGLRLVEGIDLPDFERRFGVDLRTRFAREVGELVRDGMLVLDGPALRIPEDRLLVSNRAMMRFV